MAPDEVIDGITVDVIAPKWLPAILVAMNEELAPFLQASAITTSAPTERVAGAQFVFTEINGQPVLLVASGIGLVNAATAATLAISKFGATALISSGSAGGVGPEVRVGDIVVATETCYSTADATAFGQYVLGQVPRMPARFTADPALLAAAPVTHTGLTLSGDAFIWERNYADYVGKFPDAQATDMETAAIAQVAYQFGVPWISVRGISDLCGPQAVGDFNTHIDDAAARAADAVLALLNNYAH